MTETEILIIFTQMILALRHVHSKNIVHRDLKPENVFINKEGCETNYIIGNLVVDTALSQTFNKDNIFTRTPYYISPEILCEN